MADYKAIVIDVKEKSRPNGVEEQWADITTHMPILTRDIITPALDKSSDLTSVVSGMPTVFARANLFKLAIDYIQEPAESSEKAEGLMNFYSNLVDEWRGFIACLALDYTRIEVRRISLKYSDGKDFANTANIYEPKGAFGNALFERKQLWSLQGVASNEDSSPFIDVILYEGNREGERNVVGAVSPDSLLFTSPSYKISADKCFVNRNTRKFTDPLKSALSQDEAITLYAYVEYVENRINKLGEYYAKLSEDIRPNYSTVQGNIRSWKEEISDYCKKRNFDLNAKSIPPVDKFQEPYNLVFNFSSKLWGLEGVIYDDEAAGAPNKILFDPKKVLLPKNSEIARIDFCNPEIERNPSLLENQPVYVLKAQKKGREKEYAFFALPITPLGLNVFGKNIGALTGIDSNNAIRSKLTAIYDEAAAMDNLEVTLEIITQSGKRKALKESYTVKQDRIANKDIMLWPNFISDSWNRYFLYSEMPHNTVSQQCPFNATPIVGTYENNDFRIIVDDDTKEPIILAKDGKICVPEHIKKENGLEAKFHIVSDNRVADNDYKYEIYESSLPFKGVKLSSGNKESGYLVIRYSTADNKNLPKNDLGLEPHLRKASVGIDFGSTNTSVAYSVDGNIKGIHFKNHRISLLQAGRQSACKERDLFFFQSKEIEGNAIKSILTLNDTRRYVSDFAARQEVSGGMPCFDPSLLPVEAVKENRIILRCHDIGQVTLVYNMKWTTQESDIAHKKAFLRSLMLHIYAQLYSEGCVPAFLKWSYPSAMGEILINQYSEIWRDLSHALSPVKDVPLEVCQSDIEINFPNNQKNDWGNVSNSQNPWGNMPNTGWNAGDNLGWGDSTDKETNKGWGDSSTAQSDDWGLENAWDNTPQQKKVEDLEPDNNQVDFNLQAIDSHKCMTEACAVANYMTTQQNVQMNVKSLTLCFDVGGSTTDISALIQKNNELNMIKQNSIRFAAQRVSEAAAYEPHLKEVLIEVCKQQNIRIPGLTFGPDKYNVETASFYLEQVLDRLDQEGLVTIYSLISTKCASLMAVNLYVTGLIIFYAGQLAKKLIEVIRTSMKNEPQYADFQPNVNVMFAGKGSRIFEWFSTTQNSAAQKYYTQMFIIGMGGLDIAKTLMSGWPTINLSERVSSDVKYEVSKGLALPADHNIKVPKNSMEAIEIIGEDNFVIIKASNSEEVKLKFDNAITTKMMAQLGQYFLQEPPKDSPFACNKFTEFSNLFFGAATTLYKLKMTRQDFAEGFKKMNIESYIKNMPEYRKAQQSLHEGGKFDFVAPIIILEGMKFYQECLLKKL